MRFLLLILAFFSSTACAAPELDSKRTVVINGAIGNRNILQLTSDMDRMAKDPTKPISIIISSPGGDVITGFAFINYMESIKARGVTINCFVPTIAASRAYQILLHCDNRVALSKAFLLWHGVRVQLGGGFMSGGVVMTAKGARDLANDLDGMDKVIIKELRQYMHLPLNTIMYHFNVETLHVASNLAAMDPEFLEAVDVVPGLLEALSNKNIPRSGNSDGKMEFQPGEIIYIKE